MVTEKHKEFDIWMDRVDRNVQAISGVSVWDLPDCPFADWHEAGLSPYTAATAALEDAGY